MSDILSGLVCHNTAIICVFQRLAKNLSLLIYELCLYDDMQTYAAVDKTRISFLRKALLVSQLKAIKGGFSVGSRRN